MTITSLPSAPARTDTPAIFISKADAWVASISTWTTEANTLAGTINNDAITASEASASAIAAAATSNAVKWVSGTTYAEGAGAWSPLNYKAYRRKVAGAGTTDPSLDIINWVLIEATQATVTNLLSYQFFGAL
jgi:hypothetical protein